MPHFSIKTHIVANTMFSLEDKNDQEWNVMLGTCLPPLHHHNDIQIPLDIPH